MPSHLFAQIQRKNAKGTKIQFRWKMSLKPTTIIPAKATHANSEGGTVAALGFGNGSENKSISEAKGPICVSLANSLFA